MYYYVHLYASVTRLFGNKHSDFIRVFDFKEHYILSHLSRTILYNEANLFAWNIKLSSIISQITCEKCDTSSTCYQGTNSRKIRAAN